MLPLADIGDTGEPEPGQRARHRLALGVQDLRLGHDIDDNAGHGRLLLSSRGRYHGSVPDLGVHPATRGDLRLGSLEGVNGVERGAGAGYAGDSSGP
ncbi:hypothetical protein Acsp05_12840 [Actinokineospora sp. NBRC 105648]|nr:hypothetical protein Acsp05_12840 [Actinokineospora sp. NBRC 105648]